MSDEKRYMVRGNDKGVYTFVFASSLDFTSDGKFIILRDGKGDIKHLFVSANVFGVEESKAKE